MNVRRWLKQLTTAYDIECDHDYERIGVEPSGFRVDVTSDELVAVGTETLLCDCGERHYRSVEMKRYELQLSDINDTVDK